MLENAVLEDVNVDRLRLSVMGARFSKVPIPPTAAFAFPATFWKLIAYADSDDNNKLKVKAYVLTQKDLLNDLEALELDPFRLYQVSLETLGQLTKFNSFTMNSRPSLRNRFQRNCFVRKWPVWSQVAPVRCCREMT